MRGSPSDIAPLRLGVVGTGALGRHHVRILSQLPGVELVGHYDIRSEVGEAVAREFGSRAWPSLDALAAEIEAAVVAVPTVSHAEVGCRLLEMKCHVMVEKPIAGSLDDAYRLIDSADGRVLAVGHVEFYNPAVQSLLRLDRAPGFVEIHRLAVFTPRSLDIDVVLDLMIHDLKILHSLDSSPLREVRATGISVLSARIDIANARLALDSGCVANLTASRVSAERVRKLRVFFPRKGYYSVDYQSQEVKGFRLQQVGTESNIVPDDLPVVPAEPLRRELEAFTARCRGEQIPLVDGLQGRRSLKTALSVLEAI